MKALFLDIFLAFSEATKVSLCATISSSRRNQPLAEVKGSTTSPFYVRSTSLKPRNPNVLCFASIPWLTGAIITLYLRDNCYLSESLIIRSVHEYQIKRIADY